MCYVYLEPERFSIRLLSLGNMILLHLFPGMLISAFVFLTAPVLIQAGFPPILSLYLAILLILIPFELGFLLYQGKKRNGRYSLDGVVLLHERERRVFRALPGK